MRRRRALALALVPALAACATGGIRDDELPGDPIAIVYLTSEQARRHAEALSGRGEAPPPTGGPRWVGSKANLRADLEALGGVLSDALGLAPPTEGIPLGRLALLDPRSGSLDFVEGALPGAIPLDWSPAHDRLLFTQSPQPESGELQVFEWERVERTVRRITWGPSLHPQACYGPEGRILATAVTGANGTQRSRIRISRPGGGGPWTDLTAGPADHSPTCARDGSLVAFVHADAGGSAEIRAIRAPFEDVPLRVARGRAPRFAGGGDWLVYLTTGRRSTRLARIRADGTGRAPIGAMRVDAAWPAPSPDGALVAYVAHEDVGDDWLRRRLMVRRFDGSGERVLLTRGEGEHPVW